MRPNHDSDTKYELNACTLLKFLYKYSQFPDETTQGGRVNNLCCPDFSHTENQAANVRSKTGGQFTR